MKPGASGSITFAPEKVFVRTTNLHRLVLQGDRSKAREQSESLLRDGIENRRGAHWFAVIVFSSTMLESDKTDEPLAVFEELRPGVSSPDFNPGDMKETALQYHAVLALA